MRPYTGTSDGIAKGKRAGTEEFVRQIELATDFALWNNGTFGVRKMRGKTDLSVHSTGRACDLSYRNMADKRGKPRGRRFALCVMDWLVANADEIGVELIIDYAEPKYGRAWKCTRNAWRKYETKTVSGGGSLSSDWIHVELSPAIADDAERVREVFAVRPLVCAF